MPATCSRRQYLIAATLMALSLGVGGVARASLDVRPAATSTSEHDVALQSENALHGNVVDEQGMPLADYEVWITPTQGPVVSTKTDAAGRFRVADLTPGYYRIDTLCGGGKFRLWDGKQAPATATSHVLLVVCMTKSH